MESQVLILQFENPSNVYFFFLFSGSETVELRLQESNVADLEKKMYPAL